MLVDFGFKVYKRNLVDLFFRHLLWTKKVLRKSSGLPETIYESPETEKTLVFSF